MEDEMTKLKGRVEFAIYQMKDMGDDIKEIKENQKKDKKELKELLYGDTSSFNKGAFPAIKVLEDDVKTIKDNTKDFPFKEVRDGVTNIKFIKGAITFLGISNIALIFWIIFGEMVKNVVVKEVATLIVRVSAGF